MKDKKKLEEELEVYKNRLEDAMRYGNIAWWEMELPSGEIRFNSKKAEMLGYSPKKFEHYSDFTDLIHPDDHERAMKAMKDHLEGREPRYEVEYRIKKKNNSYKWFRDVGGITEKDEAEGYKKVTGVVIEITERKEAEEHEEFLNSLLRHDLRNKIQIIKGYNELLREFDLPKKPKEYILREREGVEEAMEIIEKVKDLREAQKEDMKKVRIDTAVHEAIDKVKPRAEEMDIEIEADCPGEECTIIAGSLLDRVFSNLLENAIQHSKANKIKIHGKETENKIICTIEDDGKGIPEEEKEKIFDKGYTTNKEKGTGLGLFLVKTLINTYNGTIETKDSELGGARFDITLQKT